MSEYCPMCNGFEAEIRRLTEQLTAATARASELEREQTDRHEDLAEALGRMLMNGDTGQYEASRPYVLLIEEASQQRKLVAQRDTELAAMGERVARLESAARAVVAADTYVTPGKTRFEATTEAIGKLESLLPDLPALCAQADGKGETNG